VGLRARARGWLGTPSPAQRAEAASGEFCGCLELCRKRVWGLSLAGRLVNECARHSVPPLLLGRGDTIHGPFDIGGAAAYGKVRR